MSARPSTSPPRLIGGTPVRIRQIRPEDEPSLRAAFARLSPASRYQRFHTHLSDLSPAMWRYLTHVDGRNHVALVAVTEDALVGVVRFVRLSEEPRAAEIAIAVIDDFQRKSLGTWLLDALVVAARERCVDELVAHTLVENVAMRRLLAHHGELVTSEQCPGVSEEHRVRIARCVEKAS